MCAFPSLSVSLNVGERARIEFALCTSERSMPALASPLCPVQWAAVRLPLLGSGIMISKLGNALVSESILKCGSDRQKAACP